MAKISFIVKVLVSFSYFSCFANTSAQDDVSLGFKALHQGHYILAHEHFAKSPQKTIPLLRQLYNFVGRDDLLSAYSRYKCQPNDIDNDKEAHESVISALHSNQIIALNEDHQMAIHRGYFYSLLEPLKQAGFTHLALEALSTDIDWKKGWYAKQSGYYLQDPIFLQAIEKAKELGFKLIAYDFDRADIDANSLTNPADSRELSQAKNIFELTIEKHPEAKVFIYTGLGHISEARNQAPAPSLMMAGHIKALYGIDVYTIQQNNHFDCSDNSSSNGEWSVTQLPSPDSRRYKVDLPIAHQSVSFSSGRPKWHAQLERNLVAIPKDFIFEIPVIIEARRLDWPLEALPIERLLLFPGEELKLSLPKGKFQLIAKDKLDNILKETILKNP